MARLLGEGLIEFGADATTQPQRRYYLDENTRERIPSVLPFAGSDDALFARWGIPFEYPKPVDFAADLVAWLTAGDDLVLDFFAGSGTAGHACWLANARDGAARRFLLVQAPAPTGREDFPTVSSVTRARLVAAARDLAAASPGLACAWRERVCEAP
jgi:adenine-specific DNA-methyltransferase